VKKIGKRFFVLLSANKRLNRKNISQILDFFFLFFAFYKMSQLFLIWGCTKVCAIIYRPKSSMY